MTRYSASGSGGVPENGSVRQSSARHRPRLRSRVPSVLPSAVLFGALLLGAALFGAAPPGHAEPIPYACVDGYVWREAFPGDRVCVTPAVRTQTAIDNRLAASRRAPGGGAYGPDTCQQGFVWREARPEDHVCVTPETREQAARDNRAAPSRWQMPPPAAANGGSGPTATPPAVPPPAARSAPPPPAPVPAPDAAERPSGVAKDSAPKNGHAANGATKNGSAKKSRPRKAAKKSAVESFRLPEFPWPPPPASTRLKLPRELVVAGQPAPTNGSVARRMEQALAANGYTQISYYAIPDGFAMVTQIERIDAEAASAAEQRWSIQIDPVKLIPFSLGAYLDALLGKNGDSFRVIVFTFTPTPFVTAATPVAPETAMAWVEKGATALPAALASQPYDAAAASHALVYEFRISSLGARLQNPSAFTGDRHLRAAGILPVLERP